MVPTIFSPRKFSATARAGPIMPTTLPMAGKTPTLRWALPAAACVGVAAYALNSMSDKNRQRRSNMEAARQAEFDRLRQNELLLDAYGDRSSLEALEKAAEHYGAVSSSRT